MLDTAVAVRKAAMDLLARREHSILELTHKLRQRGASTELITAELGTLVEEGLLSESRYLESYIRSRANTGRGPERIREELARRGLAREDIEQALAEANIDWRGQLRELWCRRFGEKPIDKKMFAKQARFLIYRGYPVDWVQKLLREY